MNRSHSTYIPAALAATLLSSVIAATQLTGWMTVATENTCTARHETSAASVDGVLYLIGGRGMKPVEAFDPTTNRWTTKAMPPMQMHHFAATTIGQKIAVFGALTGGYPKEQPVPNLWWYEPAQDVWTKGPEIPEDRRRGAAGSVLDGDKLYLVCGSTDGHWSGFVPWLDCLDLKTGEWTRLPDAPHARDHFQAVIVDGKIIAAGGRRTHAEKKHVFDLTVPEVDVYDIATGKWSTLAQPIPTQRAGAPTVVRGDRVIVIGGESGKQSVAHGQMEALTPSTGAWETLSPLGQPRHSGGAAFINDDLYFVAGCTQCGGRVEQTTVEKLSWPAEKP
jgi:N-acetylneuraminic acid mutarotase